MEKKDTVNISDKNLELIVNQRYFVSAVVSLIQMVKDISFRHNDKLTDAQHKSHAKFRETCDTILSEYTSDDKSDVDQGRIIKKVFTTLKENIEFLKAKDITLFTKKNKDNKIITIVPGLNIGLIVPFLTDEYTARLWQYMYMMFVSSVRMVYMINESKKNTDVWDTMLEFEKELSKSGMLVGGKIFNPYIGLGDDGNLSMDGLLKSAEGIKQTNSGEGLLGTLGVDKLLDSEKLSEQLKNISQTDIDEATKNITELLGASGDNDVKEVCSTLVNNIVADLKENGLQSMFQVAERVSGKVGNQIDVDKMKKTATKMSNMMNDSDSKLKNLRDSNGNPIGEDILNKLSIPLGLAKMMGGGNQTNSSGNSSEKQPTKKTKQPYKHKK